MQHGNTKANRAEVLAAARMLGTEASVRQHFDNQDAKAGALAAEVVLADASRAERRKVEGNAAWSRVIANLNSRVGKAGKPDDDTHGARGGMPQPAATA